MTNQQPDERLDNLLHDLGPADPPAGFSRQVLFQIERDRSRGTGHVITFSRRAAFIKTGMWGLAAAAAMALVVFVARGFPRVDRGSEAAIGAANPPPTTETATGNEASAQQFMQSDAGALLLKDPDVVKALADASFRQQLTDPEIVAAVRNPTFLAALKEANVAQALRGSRFVAAVQNPAFARALSDARVRAAIASLAFQQAIISNGFDAALRSASFAEAIASSAAALDRR